MRPVVSLKLDEIFLIPRLDVRRVTEEGACLFISNWFSRDGDRTLTLLISTLHRHRDLQKNSLIDWLSSMSSQV